VSELADTLARLREYGLLGRVTSVRAGDVVVEMLAAPSEQAESDHAREMRDEEDRKETLFGSS